MNAIYVTMSSPNHLVQLPVEISGEDKGCAVLEIQGHVWPYVEQDLYLCVDFIEESFIGAKMMPILRRITLEKDETGGGASIRRTYDKMLWLSCNRSTIKELRTYISDAWGNFPPFVDCHISCTLVIIPRFGYK